MEGKLESHICKSVLILAAKYKYKFFNLFFARLVSRICSIYVSISLYHLCIGSMQLDFAYNPQWSLT